VEDQVMTITTRTHRLEGVTALVTGGASGIGAAAARRLAAEGAAVAVGDRDVDGAEKVAADVGGMAVPLDVTDVGSVRAAVARASTELGAIDVLVNSAGGSRFGFFVDSDEAVWNADLAVNLFGVIACTHAVLAGMHERRQGSIVNISSEAGHVGTIAGATYAAAKGGVLAFTKSIARESAARGVRCNAVVPGPIDTPLLDASVADSGALGARLRQGMIDATVMGRCGTPDEVAAAIAFLASSDASFITGETLAVSGGLSM
jgi:2-hydroxycyclohexanecarboxyl-CoA dehydrogenase